ncbi:enoyl-CoA hydratase/isomerase [Amycolatopsis anabasis]|uniref:enoyl-CoA hydratase/isomerase n=1 Tax=Amycolatopsis anabasis TaxID=1840409 RepID=UPI00131E228B|nr:enoyl-CoA hydratase/isomerase [Amycolatopsis anabasis]
MTGFRFTGLTDVDAWVEDGVCTVRIQSAGGRNTITPALVRDLGVVLDRCSADRTGGTRGTDGNGVRVLVLEGNEQTFCFGADFDGIAGGRADAPSGARSEPEHLYDLWLRLTRAPVVVVAHVRGRANAGGVGFVAASDLVLARSDATFSLSELLFGLYPALVLPFLARRVGWQAAHAMTLLTAPITAAQAADRGLADDHDQDSTRLLKRSLRRLRHLPAEGVGAYKAYMSRLGPDLAALRDVAGKANRAMFAVPATVERITRFQKDGVYPWEVAR